MSMPNKLVSTGKAILSVPLAITGIILLLVVLPITALFGLLSMLFRKLRNDPRPNFGQALPKLAEFERDGKEDTARLAFKEMQDFILSHVPKAKLEIKESQRQLIADDVAQATFISEISVKKPRVQKITLELSYIAKRYSRNRYFEVDYDDGDYSNELLIDVPLDPHNPGNRTRLRLHYDSSPAIWIAVAALRDKIKISKAKQVWFYLKEQEIWVVCYDKVDSNDHNPVIGYRNKFVDKRVGRFRFQ